MSRSGARQEVHMATGVTMKRALESRREAREQEKKATDERMRRALGNVLESGVSITQAAVNHDVPVERLRLAVKAAREKAGRP
jgi:transposase-like protein